MVKKKTWLYRFNQQKKKDCTHLWKTACANSFPHVKFLHLISTVRICFTLYSWVNNYNQISSTSLQLSSVRRILRAIISETGFFFFSFVSFFYEINLFLLKKCRRWTGDSFFFFFNMKMNDIYVMMKVFKR